MKGMYDLVVYYIIQDFMKRIICLIIAISMITSILSMPMVYANGGNDGDGEDQEEAEETEESKNSVDKYLKNYKNHSLYLDNKGDLYVWGYNFYGQLGDDSYDNSITPKKIMADVKAFSIGGNHSLALKNEGSLWTWGSNAFAQLGDGSYNNSTSPKKLWIMFLPLVRWQPFFSNKSGR